MIDKSNICNKKIIVTLIGGLGNILYQIAKGYCISKKSNRDFYIYYDNTNKDRTYNNGIIGGHKVFLPWNENVNISDIFPNLEKYFIYDINVFNNIPAHIIQSGAVFEKALTNEQIPDNEIVFLDGYFF